jgi:ribonuclease J
MNSNLCRVSGNIEPKTIYVDGVGFGNIEDIVLRDRKLLSREGIITVVVGIDMQKGEVIYKPGFILKGITYMENFDSILKECKKLIINSLRACFESNITSNNGYEKYITERLEKFIFKKARIRPVIMTRVVSI